MVLRKISVAWWLTLLSLGSAGAQLRHPPATQLEPVTVAITYNAEQSKISPGPCGCFWFQGASADADWNVWNRFGIAAEVSGAHASNIAPGTDISKINFLIGPRYTWQPVVLRRSGRRTSLFGEVLLGGEHAFDTVIPTSSGTTDSATAFALQTGAGTNLWLTPHLGLRLIEFDYTYSQLPNASNSIQNGFRIATGVTWRLR